jgi:SAM-dependent methyltransferase/FKBP-type peptidyl-prolyl cis-trans isomerase 2
MNIADYNIVADLADTDHNEPRQHSISRSSSISALISLRWQSGYATHIDSQFMARLNVGRDIFPAELEMQLDGCAAGDVLSHHFDAGTLLDEYSQAAVHTVKQSQFNRNFSSQLELQPRLGRFYPRGIFDNIPGNDSSNYQPCRITAMDDAMITTDFNHALAVHAFDIDTRIIDIREGGQEHGGRRNDIIEMLTTNGPGMQARHNDTATDFWSDDAFARQDESPDDVFYASPRLVQHLDGSCSLQIGELYRRLLPHDGRLLDLMSSWVSHLPQEFSGARVCGLGMNPQELAQNPMLAETRVHDLNRDPVLPYQDASFDGALCTASIEYLVSPRRVFDEIARVLKPGAALVITFSNRWFPPKAIRVWGHAHEFERIGLVLEYFIGSGAFENLHSFSLRGLPRPHDDTYAGQLAQSDPVYAAWGYKR